MKHGAWSLQGLAMYVTQSNSTISSRCMNFKKGVRGHGDILFHLGLSKSPYPSFDTSVPLGLDSTLRTFFAVSLSNTSGSYGYIVLSSLWITWVCNSHINQVHMHVKTWIKFKKARRGLSYHAFHEYHKKEMIYLPLS